MGAPIIQCAHYPYPVTVAIKDENFLVDHVVAVRFSLPKVSGFSDLPTLWDQINSSKVSNIMTTHYKQ